MGQGTRVERRASVVMLLSLTHQKNERTSERWFFQFPLPHEDGIEHQTSFSLTPDQIG
jgi:hypothetical protein